MITKDAENKLSKVHSWAIVLNPENESSLKSADQMDLIILDPDYSYQIDLKGKDTISIAYVSVGEAESYRTYWESIKDKPWVLMENPNWKENYLVDMRAEEWQDVLLNQVIPDIVEKGHQGLFLDTIDTASSLFADDPELYPKMLEAPKSIIQKIRKKYPKLLLIPNNGLDLFDSFATNVDAIFVEDVYSMPNFETGGYEAIAKSETDLKIKKIKNLQKKYQRPVFVVDYVSESDQGAVMQLSAKIKKNGFKPYIAEKELSRVYNPESL